MKYVAVPVSERIERLKEQYTHLPVPMEANPYIDKKYRGFATGDRWMTLGYLRGWKKYATAETTLLRNSYAEAEELYQSEPIILDNELLAGHLYFPDLSKEEQEEYDRLCDAFIMSSHTLKERPPRKCHISLDLEKLIRLGINGIKAETEAQREKLCFDNDDMYPSYESLRKKEFYDCLIIELDAVSALARKYSQKALELSEKADKKRKSELITISKILAKVPNEPATTFYEALQSIQFFLSTLFGLYPLGRPDKYLYELYKTDLESGAISKEFAQELIDNFCLCISDRVFSRAACGFMVGGQNEDGSLIENDLTYMFITALDHLKLPDPNGALAVNGKTSKELLEYAVEVLSHGTTHPAFYNDDAIINSLVNNYGVARADAVNYIHTTCAEISVVGKSRCHTTALMIDLPRLLQETTDADGNFGTLEDLLCAYGNKIKAVLKEGTVKYTTRLMEVSRIGNGPMRICSLIDDCIQKGKSIHEGGERYMFLQPIFIGFANVVDSITAIENLVYKDKRLSLRQFCDIVKSNFADNKSLRSYIVNKLPHYGNDNEKADKVAENLAVRIMEIFDDTSLPMRKHMMPGTFTYVTHAKLGEQMGATFDGRESGYSYSDGCCAVQGRDINGPTAMIKSLTSWEQERLLGGMVVNIKFSKDNLYEDKKQNLISLLKVFMERGGIELQVNVVDRKTLEDAELHPEKHQNLIVRIGGYSDYFVRLTPTLRREIIDRTEY